MRFPLKSMAIIALGWLLFPLSADATEPPTLTVYTYDTFAKKALTPELQQQFEQQCHCRLKLVGLGDAGTIMSRLQLEDRNTPADVVLGIDNNQRAEARRSGLFAPLPSRQATPTLPIEWHDPIFQPVDWGWFAFVYDHDKIAQPPQSLDALIDSDLRIVLEDPRTSTPGLGLVMWMKEVYGERAAERWQQLARHTVTVSRNWTEAYGLFLRGEADAVLSYSTSPAYHIEKEGEHRYQAMPFTEGHYMQIELAAKLASSSHQAKADQFLEFITQPAFQARMLVTTWMYPAWHDDQIERPAGYANSMAPQHTFMLDDETLERNRKAWVREWQTAMIKAKR